MGWVQHLRSRSSLSSLTKEAHILNLNLWLKSESKTFPDPCFFSQSWKLIMPLRNTLKIEKLPFSLPFFWKWTWRSGCYVATSCSCKYNLHASLHKSVAPCITDTSASPHPLSLHRCEGLKQRSILGHRDLECHWTITLPAVESHWLALLWATFCLWRSPLKNMKTIKFFFFARRSSGAISREKNDFVIYNDAKCLSWTAIIMERVLLTW